MTDTTPDTAPDTAPADRAEELVRDFQAVVVTFALATVAAHKKFGGDPDAPDRLNRILEERRANLLAALRRPPVAVVQPGDRLCQLCDGTGITPRAATLPEAQRRPTPAGPNRPVRPPPDPTFETFWDLADAERYPEFHLRVGDRIQDMARTGPVWVVETVAPHNVIARASNGETTRVINIANWGRLRTEA
jgi:hypothetical protein